MSCSIEHIARRWIWRIISCLVLFIREIRICITYHCIKRTNLWTGKLNGIRAFPNHILAHWDAGLSKWRQKIDPSGRPAQLTFRLPSLQQSFVFVHSWSGTPGLTHSVAFWYVKPPQRGNCMLQSQYLYASLQSSQVWRLNVSLQSNWSTIYLFISPLHWNWTAHRLTLINILYVSYASSSSFGVPEVA